VTKGYKYNKRWRLRHPDKFAVQNKRGDKRYKRRYPGRFNYSNQVYRLLKSQAIKKGSCVVCGNDLYVQCCTFFNRDAVHPVWLCDHHNKVFHEIMHERCLRDGMIDDGMVIIRDMRENGEY